MRVAALEIPHLYGDPSYALGAADDLLAAAPGIDLALLPEAALTGYVSPHGDFDLSCFGEPLDGPSARSLADLARRHAVAIAGPLVEKEGNRLFNALLLFNRRGELVGHFRKRHPWFPEDWATPGDRGSPVVSLDGMTITAFVCFDIHFIEEDAPDALAKADLALFPSAWVDEGEGSAEPALIAIASRFGTAIVNANWGKGTPRIAGQGGSRIVSARGEVIARARGFGGAEAVVADCLR